MRHRWAAAQCDDDAQPARCSGRRLRAAAEREIVRRQRRQRRVRWRKKLFSAVASGIRARSVLWVAVAAVLSDGACVLPCRAQDRDRAKSRRPTVSP